MNRKTIRLPMVFEGCPANDIIASYLEVGEGPTIVFIHGFLADATTWCPLMERLQGCFHCVAIDLLGFGDTSKPHIE